MRYQRLEDYIATLSESEREQYKYLIEETMQRDSAIKKNCDGMRENLGALFKSLIDNVKAMDELAIKARQFKEDVLRLHLRANVTVFILEQHDRDLLRHYPKSLN